MTDTAIAPRVPLTAPVLGDTRERLVRAGADLWRVADRHGRIIGHLRVVETGLGVRYRAERFHPATGALRAIGEFWSADEAVRTLRHLR
jgi:hypothetical protein